MTPEEYHASDGLSNSMMNKLLKSPAHMKYYMDNPDPSTPAQVLGTQAHTALLEPGSWKGVRGVEGDRRTKAVKEQHLQQVEEHGAENIIKPDAFDQIEGIVSSVLANPTAASIIRSAQDDGQIEDSLFWIDHRTHVECKARVDCVPGHSSMYSTCLADFKTTVDASPESFAKSVLNFGYARQAAHYLSGWNHLNPEDERSMFVIIACEKSPPYAVAIYELDWKALELGNYEVENLLELYAQCENEGKWGAYPETIQMLELPPWATPRIGQ